MIIYLLFIKLRYFTTQRAKTFVFLLTTNIIVTAQEKDYYMLIYDDIKISCIHVTEGCFTEKFLNDVIFEDCIFDESFLNTFTFNNCIFKNCTFNDATMYDCHFYVCKFDNCTIDKSNWSIIHIQDCTFKDTTFSNLLFFHEIKAVDTHFTKCTFKGLEKYQELNIKDSHLTSCVFDDFDLSGTMFDDCIIQSTTINKSNLKGTKFIKCIMSYVWFKYLDIHMTHFIECELADSVLDSCSISTSTRWTKTTVADVSFIKTNKPPNFIYGVKVSPTKPVFKGIGLPKTLPSQQATGKWPGNMTLQEAADSVMTPHRQQYRIRKAYRFSTVGV